MFIIKFIPKNIFKLKENDVNFFEIMCNLTLPKYKKMNSKQNFQYIQHGILIH